MLVLAMLSLTGGVLAGLLRMGWQAPSPGAASAMAHGPLMIGAFFGAVISLERAVALGTLWAYLAPLLAGLGGLAMLAGAGTAPAAALLGAGSLVMVLASLRIWQRQRALHTVTLLLGAAAWLAGNGAWLAGAAVADVVPLWIGFLVLTIAGERLELSRFLPPSPLARAAFTVIVIALLIGALTPVSTLPVAPLVFGASLLALAAWLLRQDIARRTVREHGLTRFIAICLLSGYGWLALGAVILLMSGGVSPGTAAYDAGLHAVLLGFVFAMVFGHAPIIFPAVLGLRLPYWPLFYAPLLLLHLSVAMRVAGTMLGEAALRAAGGMLNALALAAFVLVMIATAIRGHRTAAR
jgi:hypothetical protein